MRYRMNGVRRQPIHCCLHRPTYIDQSVCRNNGIPDPQLPRFLHIFSDLKLRVRPYGVDLSSNYNCRLDLCQNLYLRHNIKNQNALAFKLC